MSPRLTTMIAWIGLAAALPVMVVIAALVYLNLGRPVMFRQLRAGHNGADFELIKFRTMSVLTDTAGNPLPDHERVSRFGRFLRRTRLDELPEIFNILRGEMALVGPRPLLPQTIADLGPEGKARSGALPGLTGWAQVNGNTLLSAEEKLRLDLWYVEQRSLRLDLLILCRTIWMILGGEKRNVRSLERAFASCPNRSS